MYKITRLRDTNPLLLLFASVPVDFEPAIQQSFACSDLKIIRHNTNRTNIDYQVEVTKHSLAIATTIKKFVEAHGRAFVSTEDSRGIIYCPTIAKARELFDYLQAELDLPGQASSIVCLYHGNMTQQKKAEADSDWRSGRSPWINATSGYCWKMT
jgi:superfamily II DNA helicase RecQ